jgi:O-succinylbenzoic acid--CoA ligase
MQPSHNAVILQLVATATQLVCMAKIVLADNTFTPAAFCAASFADTWLNDVQECVSFWLSDADFLEVQTSGSTSPPKPILLPKILLKQSATATLDFLGVHHGSALLAIPAKYIGGKMLVFRALLANLDLVLVEPKAALPNLSGKYNLVSLTPMQAENSLAQLDHFENILLGGAPISASLEEKLQSCPANIYHTYGMTETASHVALRQVNGEKRSAAFTALPGISFSADARNCLVIHAQDLGIDALLTNDSVELLTAQSFVWLGRADNVINSGGVKLHPEQIEHALQRQINTPFFAAALPDEVLGQKLVLLVEGAKRHIDFSALAKLQQPREVFFIPHFVYTETDKINRPKTVDLLVAK